MPFLEDYTLLDQIGRGAYARVCKVRHNKYRYIRAVKILEQTIINGENDPLWKKFQRECGTLLTLGNGNHPNIIHIYRPMLRGMQAFVEMDFIEGCDIAHILKDTPFIEADEVIALAKDISSALAYCHHDIYKFCLDKTEDGLEDDPDDGTKPLLTPEIIDRLVKKYSIRHNDIHSGNIMRRDSGGYILLDFGLSVQDGEVLRSSKRANGAIEYKAPEKWVDSASEDTITTATDIYSFGVVLYEYLTGRVPFEIDKSVAPHVAEYRMGEAHKSETPPAIFSLRKKAYEATHPGQTLDQPDYPSWLEDVIMCCLEKDPANRFHDGKEMHDYILSQLPSEAYLQQTLSLAAENRELSEANRKLQQEISSISAALRNVQIEKAKLAQQIEKLAEELKQQKETGQANTQDYLSAFEKTSLEADNKRLKEANERLRLALAQTKPQSEKGKTPKIWIVLTILFFICAVAIGVYGYFESENAYRRVSSINSENVELRNVIDNLNNELERYRNW